MANLHRKFAENARAIYEWLKGNPMSEEYIRSLREQLKGFSSEEQEALVEEIRSHMESGEADPKMGQNLEQRRTALMAELGSPDELGRNFKAIYRQNRFIDFLWIAIPYILYPFLNMLYMDLMPKYPWADVRLDILIHVPLIAVGMWRRSATVTLFWLATIATQIAAMLLVARGYYGMAQTAFWVMALLALIALLGYLIWQNRHDALLVMVGLIPLVMCLVGSLFAIIHPGMVAVYGPVDRLLSKIYIDIAGAGGGYLPFYGTLIAMALFFLTTNRTLRWLALGLFGLVIGLSRNYVNLFDAENGLMASWVYALFAILPLAIVLLGWWVDPSKAQKVRFAE